MLPHPSEKDMQQLSGATMPRLVTVSQSSGELTPQQLNWEGWGQGGGGVREGEREMCMSGGM